MAHIRHIRGFLLNENFKSVLGIKKITSEQINPNNNHIVTTPIPDQQTTPETLSEDELRNLENNLKKNSLLIFVLVIPGILIMSLIYKILKCQIFGRCCTENQESNTSVANTNNATNGDSNNPFQSTHGEAGSRNTNNTSGSNNNPNIRHRFSSASNNNNRYRLNIHAGNHQTDYRARATENFRLRSTGEHSHQININVNISEVGSDLPPKYEELTSDSDNLPDYQSRLSTTESERSTAKDKMSRLEKMMSAAGNSESNNSNSMKKLKRSNSF